MFVFTSQCYSWRFGCGQNSKVDQKSQQSIAVSLSRKCLTTTCFHFDFFPFFIVSYPLSIIQVLTSSIVFLLMFFHIKFHKVPMRSNTCCDKAVKYLLCIKGAFSRSLTKVVCLFWWECVHSVSH